jgi:hypothetical protein
MQRQQDDLGGPVRADRRGGAAFLALQSANLLTLSFQPTYR